MANFLALADLTVGQKIRYVAKDGANKYKATVKEILKKEKLVRLDVIDGPSEGKVIKIPVEDRLLRMQGRQPGFSPASAKPAKAEAKPAKATAKASAKSTTKKKEVTEEFDLSSALEELKDIAEAQQDLMERLRALAEFYANIEGAEGEEENGEEEASEEEEETPAPKKRGRKPKAAAMADEDED